MPAPGGSRRVDAPTGGGSAGGNDAEDSLGSGLTDFVDATAEKVDVAERFTKTTPGWETVGIGPVPVPLTGAWERSNATDSLRNGSLSSHSGLSLSYPLYD